MMVVKTIKRKIHVKLIFGYRTIRMYVLMLFGYNCSKCNLYSNRCESYRDIGYCGLCGGIENLHPCMHFELAKSSTKPKGDET